MSGTTHHGYRILPKKFLVVLAGNTNGAHRELVARLRVSLLEVTAAEECDYVLLFCPVASRVGTDVGIALRKAPAGKAIVLVVMHHTFDPEHVVADSRRLVSDRPSVQLAVDCLFYENHFLYCRFNDDAWCRVINHMSPSQGRDLRFSVRRSLPVWEWTPHRLWIVGFILFVLLIMMIIILVKLSDGSI